MSNNIEIWKPVVGWEDSYMVSNLGRVKNKNGKILSPCDNGKGYKSAGGSIWEYYETDRYLIALMNKNIKDREKRKVA